MYTNKKNNCQIRMILSINSILGQSVCFSMKNGHSLNKYWNSFPNSNANQSTCIKVNIQMLFFVFIIMRRYDNKPNTSNVLSFFSLHNYLVSFLFLENAEIEYEWNIKGHNSIRPLNLDSPTRLQHHQCHHHRIIPRRFLSPHHSL